MKILVKPGKREGDTKTLFHGGIREGDLQREVDGGIRLSVIAADIYTANASQQYTLVFDPEDIKHLSRVTERPVA